MARLDLDFQNQVTDREQGDAIRLFLSLKVRSMLLCSDVRTYAPTQLVADESRPGGDNDAVDIEDAFVDGDTGFLIWNRTMSNVSCWDVLHRAEACR